MKQKVKGIKSKIYHYSLLLIFLSCISCSINSNTDKNCAVAEKSWTEKQIEYSDSCYMYFGHGYDCTPIKLMIDNNLILDTVLNPNIVEEAEFYEEIKFGRNQEVELIIEGKCFFISENVKSYLMKVDYHDGGVLVWNYNESELTDMYNH